MIELNDDQKNWIKIAFRAGAGLQETSEVIMLSLLTGKPATEVRNIMMDAARVVGKEFVLNRNEFMNQLKADAPYPKPGHNHD